MSIELENPPTIMGKIDAAANYVAQIRLALAMRDFGHAGDCIESAANLLSDATEQCEKEGVE